MITCREIIASIKDFPDTSALHRESRAMTRINKTKRQRRLRPVAVEFEMTGLVIGGGCGMLAGFIVEVILRRSMIIMFGGGVVGIAIGSLVELIRFWSRKRGQRKTRKP